MLLLRWLQLRSTFGWSMANLRALLLMNLITTSEAGHSCLGQQFGNAFHGDPAQVTSGGNQPGC
jgi:hypothetical protein